jgi:hypothetical protein
LSLNEPISIYVMICWSDNCTDIKRGWFNGKVLSSFIDDNDVCMFTVLYELDNSSKDNSRDQLADGLREYALYSNGHPSYYHNDEMAKTFYRMQI